MPYSTVPGQLVSTLIEQYPSTREELHAIRDPRQPSRFQGVYGHRHGGINRGQSRYLVNAYRARVFKFFELGSGFDSKEEAARAVVAFYKCFFGERWQTAFRYRKVTPWRVRRVGSGYAVDIFVRGKTVGITRADVGDGRVSEWVWATLPEAKLAARLAMQKRFERERSQLPIPAPGLLFWRA